MIRERWLIKFDDGTERDVYINAEPLADCPLSEKRRIVRLLMSDKFEKQCVWARHWENRRA